MADGTIKIAVDLDSSSLQTLRKRQNKTVDKGAKGW